MLLKQDSFIVNLQTCNNILVVFVGGFSQMNSKGRYDYNTTT